MVLARILAVPSFCCKDCCVCRACHALLLLVATCATSRKYRASPHLKPQTREWRKCFAWRPCLFASRHHSCGLVEHPLPENSVSNSYRNRQRRCLVWKHARSTPSNGRGRVRKPRLMCAVYWSQLCLRWSLIHGLLVVVPLLMFTSHLMASQQGIDNHCNCACMDINTPQSRT